jgi:hypothetical protein
MARCKPNVVGLLLSLLLASLTVTFATTVEGALNDM